MIESHFGESSPLSLGVEEEVMILDARTLAPAGEVHVLVEGVRGLGLPGTLKTELHASVVELTTDICGGIGEAVEALRALAASIGAAVEAEREEPGVRVVRIVLPAAASSGSSAP